jgi:hypothetical protein
MWETAKRLFESVKNVVNALAPGLKNIGPDLAAEGERVVEHGATEFAAAIAAGNAFVLYGPGQQRPDRDRDEHSQESQETQLERGGLER